MKKGNVLSDSFEQLVELGQSTAKQGTKQVAQTFSPLKIIDQLTGKSQDRVSEVKGGSTEDGGGTPEVKADKSTPLDLKNLHQQYQDQEKTKLEGLRNRLFQMVKRDDEKILERKKAENQQKIEKEKSENEQKKQQSFKQQQAQQAELEPHGKIRRSIFSRKKVVQRSQQEIRPATGKQ